MKFGASYVEHPLYFYLWFMYLIFIYCGLFFHCLKLLIFSCHCSIFLIANLEGNCGQQLLDHWMH